LCSINRKLLNELGKRELANFNARTHTSSQPLIEIRPSIATNTRRFLQPKKQELQLEPLSLSQSRGDYFFAAALAFFAGALAATLATGLAAIFAFA